MTGTFEKATLLASEMSQWIKCSPIPRLTKSQVWPLTSVIPVLPQQDGRCKEGNYPSRISWASQPGAHRTAETKSWFISDLTMMFSTHSPRWALAPWRDKSTFPKGLEKQTFQTHIPTPTHTYTDHTHSYTRTQHISRCNGSMCDPTHGLINLWPMGSEM